ncbi:resistance-like protein [Trifolium medium]|uniref:Resistance-like protein n=1 Tax=Trifolium medium TaxID=97028 RepID=A0A392SNE4_9FABA|nr:resistance-like protein [Trifolium medium]
MGSEANFAAPSIPKFDGNYDHWSMVMENLLRSKEYWVAVESGYTETNSRDGMTTTQIKNL